MRIKRGRREVGEAVDFSVELLACGDRTESRQKREEMAGI